jgi:2-polyprenyl-3-methyl-5-hydroxy-6-metoxy-1,4-benzoquinol methylase
LPIGDRVAPTREVTNMTKPHYVIRGGMEGRERLRVLARVMSPTTDDLLDRLAIDPSARCLDIGCGGGDVTVALARRARDGAAVGVDVDETKIDVARAEAADAGVDNVEFRLQDVTDPTPGGDLFDLVYARFLLTHLPDPAAALSNMRQQLVGGGVLVIEDIDFSGHFCEPDSSAFRRYVELYTTAVQGRGCDPNIGPRLPGLLRDTGLDRVAVNVVQPAGISGEVKLISPLTLEAIADAVLAAGLADPDELGELVDDLYAFAGEDGTFMSIPRIVQAWGFAPA